MADTADVENALRDLIAAATAGQKVKVFRGWPIPAQLDEDLAAGVTSVSVYPSDTETKVTRHQPQDVELPSPALTLSLTATGNTVTVAGVPMRCNAAVITDRQAYVYPVQPTDTLAGVAQGLAALIPGAVASGATLAVPGARVTARAAGFGTTVRELKRQRRGYQVTLWCADPATRDALAPLVDAALAWADRLALPDGTSARLLYERSRVSDRAERDGLYRRDLFYAAEFSTTLRTDAARVAAEVLTAKTPADATIFTTAT